uniref:Uncharacterized protein n=1 Tax=Triticum urartu TaxID=4572 RepID=A0A8R7QMN0_TRIUA
MLLGVHRNAGAWWHYEAWSGAYGRSGAAWWNTCRGEQEA